MDLNFADDGESSGDGEVNGKRHVPVPIRHHRLRQRELVLHPADAQPRHALLLHEPPKHLQHVAGARAHDGDADGVEDVGRVRPAASRMRRHILSELLLHPGLRLDRSRVQLHSPHALLEGAVEGADDGALRAIVRVSLGSFGRHLAAEDLDDPGPEVMVEEGSPARELRHKDVLLGQRAEGEEGAVLLVLVLNSVDGRVTDRLHRLVVLSIRTGVTGLRSRLGVDGIVSVLSDHID
mmetsp:Transcript_20280/g.67650  ORF Transcript_20280/g.67650 Transcript_20280/m.67650 type:complete len:237 (-) Transcript_20280:2486-3196(-)